MVWSYIYLSICFQILKTDHKPHFPDLGKAVPRHAVRGRGRMRQGLACESFRPHVDAGSALRPVVLLPDSSVWFLFFFFFSSAVIEIHTGA